MIGLFFLSFVTPWLGAIALEFRSFEFFWLSIFGIVICGNLTAPKDPLKGWISGVLGLFAALIGMDVIQAFPRYTFGSVELSGGLSLIPALVGLYGIPEVLSALSGTQKQEKAMQIKRVIPRMRDLWDNRKNIVRWGLLVNLFSKVVLWSSNANRSESSRSGTVRNMVGTPMPTA